MTPSRRILPLLLLLFIGSGCAALIYEIVWFQLLELVIGSSAISLGVLLETFMGGLCVGSLLLPRLISTRYNPLRLYAILELGIGLFGLVILLAMPSLADAYADLFTPGLFSVLGRAVICAMCLLPPTLLMGATLPVVARSVRATADGVAWMGFLYAANTAGAVIGCLCAGFYLLRLFDIATATGVAVGINVVLGIVALVASMSPHGWTASRIPPEKAAPKGQPAQPIPRVYWVIGLSGLAALGGEAVWTRLMSLLFGATVYAFSIILAVFLLGLACGGVWGAWLARRVSRPLRTLGIVQLCLVGAVAWAACAIARALPFWPVDPRITPDPIFTFQLDLVRCGWAIFPATFLWGASFPLALAAAAAHQTRTDRLVGRVYAANTLGAIIGAVGFTVAVIPVIGTQGAQRIMIGLSALAAIVAIGRPAAVAATIGLAALLAWSVAPIPWRLVAFGPSVASQQGVYRNLFVGEGMTSSVAVTEMPDGIRGFHVAGKVEASTEPRDMRLQRMLGSLPALLHPKPQSVLIVGCGAGVTAGCFVVQPAVRRIAICEIEPLVPRIVANYFAKENFDVIHDPRTEVIIDDGRHFLRTVREKFDIITSDPINPFVKGAAALYTREYFQTCRDHLNPGGIVTQWVPLYQSNTEAVKSELATFFQVFPGGTVWSNAVSGQGYDLVLLGSTDEPMVIDVDQAIQRMRQPNRRFAVAALADVGFASVPDVLATYAGQASDLRPWLAGAQINRDANLRLEFLAGQAFNLDDSHAIYDQMLSYYRYPSNLFQASTRTQALLNAAMIRARR